MIAAALRNRMASCIATWARQRQGADSASVTLQRRRVYILPTRFGLIFAGLVLAMLLGSLNYSSSLGFALTFLLTGLGLVTLHHCHGNLLGTSVRFVGAHPVFAGQDARFRIGIANGARVTRYEIELALGDGEAGPVDVPPGELAVLQLPVPAGGRGWVRLPRFSVATRHPGNLCRAWTWVHMDARCLVYPEPAPPGRPVPHGTDRTGTGRTPDRGDADFAGLRNAAPGDSPRRIAWKAYARNDQLLLKQFSGGDDRPEIYDYASLPSLDLEQRLAQLARWCLDAAAAERSFGLRLPSLVIALGSGERHLHRCLEALALFELPADGAADA